MAVLFLASSVSYGQSVDSAAGKLVNFPSKLFGRIQSKTASLNQQLTRQTQQYLAKMARREEKLRKKLYTVDSPAAKTVFTQSSQQYSALVQKIQTDTGNRHASIGGQYQPAVDSLQGMLSFLQKNPQLVSGSGEQLSPAMQTQLQASISQLQTLQAKMQDADQAKAFIQQRKQQIGQYISQHANLQTLFAEQYAGMNQDVYYYSQQVRQYREMLNNPDQMEQRALGLLSQLPAFQQFMRNNSQLGSLFNLPGNYGSAQTLTGLQTRDQVSQLVQNQVATGSSGGAALQSNLTSAESQLDTYKSKLSQLGGGNGDMDMPDFKPNDQKTKTFWKRLEYGTNFQTTHDNYYFPTVTDLGFSLGYKLGNSNVTGVGASYKIGWGNGIQHVALSSQGVGLRSFIEIKIKSSFSATGGLEYNYTTPFTAYQQLKQLQYWTQSGLIGVTKTVSMKSRFFKKTKLQLLWDFLSYQQVPKTQAILFRVGYTF
ncbi:MAG TPA: hypothetical protein VGM30_07645 [Puia sp.]